MDVFVHRRSAKRVELLEGVDDSARVVDVIEVEDGESVWLVGDEEIVEVDVTVTMAEAEIPHRGHIHVNRCREVATTVHFNGSKEHQFHPGARVKRVFEWAVGKDGFDLSPTDATEHVLQLCNSKVQPDEDDHLGSFVGNECKVCFDLVPKHRAEG